MPQETLANSVLNDGEREGGSRRALFLSACALVCAVMALFATEWGPFLQDDLESIVENPSVHGFHPPWKPLFSPPGTTGWGRPVANFSFAVNNALAPHEPRAWIFQLTNLFFHVFACLFLFGILRRTFSSGKMARGYGRSATLLAFLSALAWAVHPLHAETVAHVSQRPLSLMAMFFLMSLYCAIRGWEGQKARTWRIFCILAFLLGAGAGEMMAPALLLIFLYDRVFVHASVREALAKSRGLYLGLGAGALLSLLLAARVWPLAGNAWAEFPGRWPYLLSWPMTTARCLWPSAWRHFSGMGSLWQDTSWALGTISWAVLALLAAWTLRDLLKRQSPLGFAAAWFLVFSAPFAAVIPRPDLAGEPRMALPLIPVATAGVAGVWRLMTLIRAKGPWMKKIGTVAFAAMMAFFIAFPCVETLVRVRATFNALSYWAGIVKQRPSDPWAQYHLGYAMALTGRNAEAITHFRESVRINPSVLVAQYNLANMLMRTGDLDGAVFHYARAVALRPENVYVRNNLAVALIRQGRFAEAEKEARRTLELAPGYAKAHENLGIALAAMGNHQEAVVHFNEALRLGPAPSLYVEMGDSLCQLAKWPEAVLQYQEALRARPGDVSAETSLANALWNMGHYAEAIGHLEKAARLCPMDPAVLYNLGFALLQSGKRRQARGYFLQVLRLDPDNEHAWTCLKIAESRGGGPLN